MDKTLREQLKTEINIRQRRRVERTRSANSQLMREIDRMCKDNPKMEESVVVHDRSDSAKSKSKPGRKHWAEKRTVRS